MAGAPSVPGAILLVENEPALQHGLLRYLRHAGLEVEIAGGRTEALEALDRRRFGAVISDLRLSGGGGEEGLEVLWEAKARWSGCRTILVTGYGGPEVQREAGRAGVDHYLEKPFSLDALWRALAAPDGGTGAAWTAGTADERTEENNHEHA